MRCVGLELSYVEPVNQLQIMSASQQVHVVALKSLFASSFTYSQAKADIQPAFCLHTHLT